MPSTPVLVILAALSLSGIWLLTRPQETKRMIGALTLAAVGIYLAASWLQTPLARLVTFAMLIAVLAFATRILDY